MVSLMKKLLSIDSCVLRETSRTKRIADALVEHLLSTGEYVLEQLVLEDLCLLPLTSKTLARRNELRYARDYDDAMLDLAHQFAEADEIVIARGDLGNAMPLWELPAAQKRIEAQCRKAGKPFMVVTQMLASMEQNPVPTRAEVSDIFNAVADGAAAVMVTGETAVGKWPVEVIRYLSNTVQAAERFLREG